MFVILVVLATAIGQQMGSSVSNCANVLPGGVYNTTTGLCYNATVTTGVASIAAQNSFFIVGQLGQAGLASYLPLIFIAAIAIGIISMLGFNIGKGKY